MFNGILFRDKILSYSVLFAGVGLAVGVKKAYDGFETDTANCNL